MDVLALSANLLLIAALVAMFAEAVSRRLFAPPWLRYGIAAAAVMMAADLAVYLGGAQSVPVWFYAAATVVLAARVVTETVVGLAAAERLGLRPLPVLRPRSHGGHRRAFRAAGAGVACGLLLAAWSTALFVVTEPVPADGGTVLPWYMPDGIAVVDFLGGFLAGVLVTALGEELTFRLGIQNWLAARLGRGESGYRAAIVLASALWSLGHLGRTDPEWVKLAQIFPAGLLLGWLFRRAGFEACVIAHVVLNLVMPQVTPRVLG